MQVNRNYSSSIDLSTEKFFSTGQKAKTYFEVMVTIVAVFKSMKQILSGAHGEPANIDLLQKLKEAAADCLNDPTGQLSKDLRFIPIEAGIASKLYLYNVVKGTLKKKFDENTPELDLLDQLKINSVEASITRASKSGTLSVAKIAHRVSKLWIQQLALLTGLEVSPIDKNLKAVIKNNENFTFSKRHNETSATRVITHFNCFNYAFHKLDLPEAKFLNDNRNLITQEYQLTLNPLVKIISELNFKPTAHPKAGDLIAFLDENKIPVHYGVMMENGYVDSKLSDHPAFKHKPEDCPYGQSYIILSQNADVVVSKPPQ